MMWRRRKSIVSPRQQFWFALELVAIAIGFNLICGFLLFVPPFTGFLGDPGEADALRQIFMEFVLLRWPLVMIGMAILLVIGILLAHRLAGPLFGLERVIASWRSGNRTARVHFRKYDYLLPVKESLNSFFNEQEKLLSEAGRLAKEIKGETSTEGAKAKAGEIIALLHGKGDAS